MSRCDNACLLSCEGPDARPYPLKLTVQLSFAAQREQSERIRREREKEAAQLNERAIMKALTLAILLPSLCLAFDECLTPTLDNGWIEAAPGSGPDSFVGRFRCREGFLLSGESRVKCRAGVWSQASLPVCTALMACPEEELPTIDNGYRRGVANLQNSVYRFQIVILNLQSWLKYL